MNTTSLFVELVVIGVGVLAWVILLLCLMIGVDWLGMLSGMNLFASIPLLSFVYLAGIIWDRVSDYFFEERLGMKMRSNFFDSKEQYFAARREILMTAEPFSKLFEYSRSRSRICRGWILSAIIISILWSCVILLHFPNIEGAVYLAMSGTGLALLVALGSFFAWYNLTVTEYRKVKGQAEYLLGRNSTE